MSLEKNPLESTVFDAKRPESAETLNLPMQIGERIVLQEKAAKQIFTFTLFSATAGKMIFESESGKTLEMQPEKISQIQNGQAELIQAASSPDDLYLAIDAMGGLQGSKQFYTADQLKELITKVLSGQEEIQVITSAAGLRKKVDALLAANKTERQGTTFEAAQNFKEFIAAIHTSGGLQSKDRFYAPEDLLKLLQTFRSGQLNEDFLPTAKRFRETAQRLKKQERAEEVF